MKRKWSIFGLFLVLLLAGVHARAITTSSVENVSSEPPVHAPTVPPAILPLTKQPHEPFHLESVKIGGIRLEASYASEDIVLGFNKRHETVIHGSAKLRIIVFGQNFNKLGAITFTGDGSCDDLPTFLEADFSSLTTTRLVFEMSFPETPKASTYRLCVSEKFFDAPRFVLIEDPFTKVTTEIPPDENPYESYIATPILILLLAFSGLFSGLNLGLMTLTVPELQLYIACGTPDEKWRAEKILPLRKKGNQLLCTILLGNVLVNVKISTYLSYLTGGSTWAVFWATMFIVLFGEIIPQAICVKWGLSIGARTSRITLLLFYLMWPVTKIIALVLDCFLKEDITTRLERRQLMEMLRMSEKCGTDGQDDFKMVLGALELYDKTVEHAMTQFQDIFMLPHTFKLGPAYVNKILEMGYTRIPIFENDKQNIVGLLFVKDLALLDPKDDIDVISIMNLYKHQVRRVFNDMPLRTMLEEFKKGEYHLALVEKCVEREDKDPVYEICGLITLEDIIEEIIQCEIIDETDAVIDNVHKKKRTRRVNNNIAQIVSKKASCDINIQLLVVTIQFMSVHHRIFAAPFIVPNILERLIVHKCRKVEKTQFSCLKEEGILQSKPAMLYTKGEFSSSYILILSGRAVVTIGKESMKLEAGAWHNLGTEVLTSVTEAIERSREGTDCSTVSLNTEIENNKIGFIPDFDAEIMFDCTFIEITAADILHAYNMSQLHISSEQPARCNSTTSVFEIVNTEQPEEEDTTHTPRYRSQSERETVQLLPIEEGCKFSNGDVNIV